VSEFPLLAGVRSSVLGDESPDLGAMVGTAFGCVLSGELDCVGERVDERPGTVVSRGVEICGACHCVRDGGVTLGPEKNFDRR